MMRNRRINAARATSSCASQTGNCFITIVVALDTDVDLFSDSARRTLGIAAKCTKTSGAASTSAVN